MARFPTTHWGCLAEAADPGLPGADAAVAEICRSYWYPIYSYIRARGHSAAEAADLTQDYFVRLLEGRLLGAADRRKGRFRDLLRTDCGFFLADRNDRLWARKRGGGVGNLALDITAADRRYRLGPCDRLDPDRLFDRAWALDVVNQALDRLAREEIEAGRAKAFEHFREILEGEGRAVSYRTLAERLGSTAIAIEGAVRRLRKRYRVALRATVAETLDHPTEADVADEIQELFAALAR